MAAKKPSKTPKNGPFASGYDDDVLVFEKLREIAFLAGEVRKLESAEIVRLRVERAAAVNRGRRHYCFVGRFILRRNAR